MTEFWDDFLHDKETFENVVKMAILFGGTLIVWICLVLFLDMEY